MELTGSATKPHRGVDLISDALPFGRLWCNAPNLNIVLLLLSR
jgi:hypothetical protein